MIRCFSISLALCGFLIAVCAQGATPTPLQDDAGLHDVQFVGTKTGFAVGDRGVIWKTTDGGKNWSLLDSPVDCSFRSVCFLTEQHGWVAGGRYQPYSRHGEGVILKTTDGGETWSQLAKQELPRLQRVKFVGPEEGFVVGDATTNAPTGIFSTTDGGVTWTAFTGPRTAGWLAADFANTRVGVIGAIAGERGRVAVSTDNKLLAARVNDLGLRGLRDLVLLNDGSGWLVGDGALVMTTENSGIVWMPPPTPLPPELAQMNGFRAVAAHGESVWVAGRPGSVIWNSPDKGRTWIKQATGQTQPIDAIHFSDTRHGCAVGALGTILQTADGGTTWQVVRGNNRRLALLTIHARPEAADLELFTKQAADQGYRAAMEVVARHDLGPDGYRHHETAARLNEALVVAGGAEVNFGWQLPMNTPELGHNAPQLVAQWNAYTEGRLEQTLVGNLVAALRTWRPSVVVVDQPGSDDAPTRLLNSALMQAVEQASDPTRFLKQRELAGLTPWKVQKVYLKLAPGSTGTTHVDPDELLPYLGTSAHIASAPAYARLESSALRKPVRHAYRTVIDHTEAAGRGDFFHGVFLYPGSESRRALPETDSAVSESQADLIRRHRNFRAYTSRILDDPMRSSQLIGELRGVTRGMSRQQAALLLLELAAEYRAEAQWDNVEETYVELVSQYPEQEASLEAMFWLFRFWSSTETAWQRSRRVDVRDVRVTARTQGEFENDLQQAIAEIRAGEAPATRQVGATQANAGTSSLRNLEKKSDYSEWRSDVVRDWQERALELQKTIERNAPRLVSSPEFRFPLAALLRQHGASRTPDSIYRKLASAAPDDLWRKTALTEIWATNPITEVPTQVLACRYTRERPTLDSDLSDSCWQGSQPVVLGNPPRTVGSTRPPALLMFAYDNEYLYVGGSFPKAAELDYAPSYSNVRTYDAIEPGFDRMAFFFDVDRDYATWYEMQIDQRGMTGDLCWEDRNWNPTWHVASKQDRTHWRFEAAIPFSELVPRPPEQKSFWAVGLSRILPTVGVETWTPNAGTRPRPESFGLLRFD